MSRIKELRKASKLSQAELAQIVNVDQTAVSKWELGKSFPDMAIAIRLADHFDVSVDFLLGRTDEPVPEAIALDKALSEIDFALYGATKDLTDAVKREVLAFARFKGQGDTQKDDVN